MFDIKMAIVTRFNHIPNKAISDKHQNTMGVIANNFNLRDADDNNDVTSGCP